MCVCVCVSVCVRVCACVWRVCVAFYQIASSINEKLTFALMFALPRPRLAATRSPAECDTGKEGARAQAQRTHRIARSHFCFLDNAHTLQTVSLTRTVLHTPCACRCVSAASSTNVHPPGCRSSARKPALLRPYDALCYESSGPAVFWAWRMNMASNCNSQA